MVLSDGKNHAPGLQNNGPFLLMNPFSSRCCQHNHAAGWVYYAENSWMATPDQGLAAQLYSEGEVKAKVGDGTEVSLKETTHYPFDETVSFTITSSKSLSFPLYLRIPAWCESATVMVNNKKVNVASVSGSYIKLSNQWKSGDKIVLKIPMKLKLREWEKNKNSVSVNYGPLTYSLKIEENYVQKDSKAIAIDDSRWQEGADSKKWPSFEILPGSAWNYGLVFDKQNPENSFSLVKKEWPKDNNPFTNANAPLELKTKGKKLNNWIIDQYGLCGVLPQSPVQTNETETNLILVPMGGARLRIASFPVVK